MRAHLHSFLPSICIHTAMPCPATLAHRHFIYPGVIPHPIHPGGGHAPIRAPFRPIFIHSHPSPSVVRVPAPNVARWCGQCDRKTMRFLRDRGGHSTARRVCPLPTGSAWVAVRCCGCRQATQGDPRKSPRFHSPATILLQLLGHGTWAQVRLIVRLWQ